MTLAKRPAKATTKATTRKKKAPKRRARRKPNPYLAWRKRLDRTRPGLISFARDGLAGLYGHQSTAPFTAG